MNKIVSINEAVKISQKLRKQNKIIIVAGGFFDILHAGHIEFLQAAKKYGDCLFILLEEDSKAKEKGRVRPVNFQRNRAKVLSALESINYIIMLKNMTNNSLYDKLMIKIRPNIIAATYGDPNIGHKKRQAELIQAKIVYAVKRINSQSTTKYIKLIDLNK